MADVELSRVKENRNESVFMDAPDRIWAAVVRQIDGNDAEKEVQHQEYEQLALLGGRFNKT